MASTEAPPGSREANGNTLDSKLESPSTTSTTTANNNNLNVKGAEGTTLATTPRGSVEDLSEYTDADESVSSAPTEFLAEFLSAVMMKDYEKALKYCKLILQYEPNNATAQEFYPLIVEKLQLMSEQEYSNGNSTSTTSSSDENASADSSSDSEEKPSGESDTDATTASYSSLEDEEADFEKHQQHNDNSDVGNGNKIVTVEKHISNPEVVSISSNKKDMVPAFQSTSSDSESPTEPVSQPTIAQLQRQGVSHPADSSIRNFLQSQSRMKYPLPERSLSQNFKD